MLYGQGKGVLMREEQDPVDIKVSQPEVVADNPFWYVMIHLSPQWIDTMLDRECRGELSRVGGRASDPLLEPFSYYVPYLDIQADKSLDARDDFRNFVFLRGSEQRVRQIVSSEWNTKSRLHLYHYRNKQGEAIKVSDKDLNRLRSIFRQHYLRCFFGVPVQPLQGFSKGSKVRIRLPYWEEKEGEIRRIHLRDGSKRASMRVAFTIEGLEREVTFPDLHEGDVEFCDLQTEQLLSGKVIENFEHEVAILLGHRFAVDKKLSGAAREAYLTEKKREDTPKLRRLLSFADIDIDDSDDRQRFAALMLMCAALLQDTAAVSRYRSQVEQYLKADGVGAYTQAYLTIALFVATRDPNLRTAVKAYRAAHPDCPAILTRFYNKVRDLRTH
jgi:hypothetical protein